MSEHFSTVHASPLKGIVRHPVILIPADLCCHKHIDPGFFQYLRKGPGITEYIRKPEIFHFFSEFLFYKFTSDKNLAGKGLSAGQIAVRFYPHAAVYFPASLFNSLFDLLINFREIFFYIFIKLGLGLKKNIFRKHFHHSQHSRKRSGSFFMGMFQPPQPGHINMRMPYAFNLYKAVLFHSVDFFIQEIICLMKRIIKFSASRISPVDQKAGLIQGSPQFVFYRIFFIQTLDCIQHQHTQVIKIICLFIQISQIGPVDPVLLYSGYSSPFQT